MSKVLDPYNAKCPKCGSRDIDISANCKGSYLVCCECGKTFGGKK